MYLPKLPSSCLGGERSQRLPWPPTVPTVPDQKRHHFVPEFYLQRFADENGRGAKTRGISSSSTNDAAATYRTSDEDAT